ncbi:MAG TPA: haloacid dehalogenase type II [Acetobacteraceae bacterium]|nr:haloacid dehalogenase type II [Acetobacteraceae bacterium]
MAELRAVVFDAYGTLLDVHSAMARHAERIGPLWQQVSADWRTKQLEYSWVRSLTGPAAHRDFWRLTEEALAWAASRHGIGDAAVLADVRQAYRRLDAYPDAPSTLRCLRDAGLGRAILSNGEPGMLRDAVQAAGIESLLDAVFSIEAVGVYKPDPRVYGLATARFGVEPERIAFVSSNAWDAFGATEFGFRVFWINRLGQPAEYDLPATATVLTSLAALPDAVASL